MEGLSCNQFAVVGLRQPGWSWWALAVALALALALGAGVVVGAAQPVSSCPVARRLLPLYRGRFIRVGELNRGRLVCAQPAPI